MEMNDFIRKSIDLYGENGENLKDYEFILLKKQDYVENDIFCLFYKNSETRIGWLFPIDSISSENHDCFSGDRRPHYEVYAKLAADHLKVILALNTDNYHLAVLKKENLPRDCSTNSFICSLAKYGYNQSTFDDTRLYYSNKLCSEKINSAKESKKLVLKPNFLDHNFIYDLFNHLKVERHFYLRFILIYQLYELLIEKVFFAKISNFRDKKFNLATIRDKIGEISSERKLINILFESLKIDKNPESIFLDSAREFLKEYKEISYLSSELSMPNIIYDIRSLLVHSFYKFNSSHDLMSDFVDSFELKTIEILLENENLKELLG